MLLDHTEIGSSGIVIDPFAGSGVTGTAARAAGLSFAGIEAHPLMAELASLKLADPPGEPDNLKASIRTLAIKADALSKRRSRDSNKESDLVVRSFSDPVLTDLVTLRDLIKDGFAGEWYDYVKWALLATLRDVSSVRVGWPYQRPRQKRRPPHSQPIRRFIERGSWIAEDLLAIHHSSSTSNAAEVICGDASNPATWAQIYNRKPNACISSPPYLNNFDYADATRLELYFWQEVMTWAQMCSKIRVNMMTATTQQTSVGAARSARLELDKTGDVGTRILELTDLLEAERKRRKRGKEYDRVVPDYFAAIRRVLINLSSYLAPGAISIWLVGDSAPYGVYIDTPLLIGAIAEQVGFSVEKDTTLRYRGQRWSTNSTRHNVELSERLLVLRRQQGVFQG